MPRAADKSSTTVVASPRARGVWTSIFWDYRSLSKITKCVSRLMRIMQLITIDCVMFSTTCLTNFKQEADTDADAA